MGAFRIRKSYYMAVNDWIVFTGRVVQEPVVGGMWIDLPRALRGPGRVRIHSLQEVKFTDRIELGLIIMFPDLAPTPLFDPSMVEGRTLEVVG